MTLIEWEPEFVLGIPRSDADRRNIIGLINGLNEQLQSAQHRTTIVALLKKLHSSAAKHFAHEEAVMRECGDDEYEELAAEHHRLLDRIKTCISDCQTEPLDDGTAKWLANWFRYHFQSHDVRL